MPEAKVAKEEPMTEREALAELEEKMFGIYRPALKKETVTDKTFIPLKTGIPNLKFLRYGPEHILEATENEPLY